MTTASTSCPATTTSVVEGFYRALAAGDAATAAALLDDDVVLHVPGSHPLAGDHHGPDGVLRFAAGTRALTDDGERIELVDVLAGQRFTAAYCRVTARRAGRPPLDNPTVHLLRVEDGRIREGWLHNWDDVAVDGFWR